MTDWTGWLTRDASFWNYPDTVKPKKYHLSNDIGMALCGQRIWLDKYSSMGDVPAIRKCKRCQKIAAKRSEQ